MRRSATKSPGGSTRLKHGCARQFILTVKSQVNERHGFAGKAIRGTTCVKFDLVPGVVGRANPTRRYCDGPLTAF